MEATTTIGKTITVAEDASVASYEATEIAGRVAEMAEIGYNMLQLWTKPPARSTGP